ncbi:acetyl-coenzyme A synthetase 2-like, mitochondrial [Physeter macrocephalus]|uniref:Acetyl-coenzyme A synthetase 2-like, mitochondrial n=1 Tax=Physeter macrocephalus TaxID=9755 RepID=A0A455C1F6_PHYMC|nr:acetyl-coenzyme A synthetase 2-like, mitochondrial [Physeter catodon]|eukprot:XP_028353803.1 acetyl-coenzyme A synthetase 2-like, mitochondrial [Physeter catodon]
MAARCLGRGVVRLLGGLRGVGARGLAAPRLWGSASAPAAPAGSYQERIALAASEPAAFWGPLARDVLVWDTPYHTVSDCDFRSGRIGWFLGGQLNVSGLQGWRNAPWMGESRVQRDGAEGCSSFGSCVGFGRPEAAGTFKGSTDVFAPWV